MPIAAERLPVGLVAFDGRFRGHGIRTGIALRSILRELDRHERLRARHHDIGNSDQRARIGTFAEIGVQARGQPDGCDQIVGIRIDGRFGDVCVPRIACRKRHCAVQRRTDAEARIRQGAILPGGRLCLCERHDKRCGGDQSDERLRLHGAILPRLLLHHSAFAGAGQRHHAQHVPTRSNSCRAG
jgi:hypothetical protein